MNSIAKVLNSTAKVTNSIAKICRIPLNSSGCCVRVTALLEYIIIYGIVDAHAVMCAEVFVVSRQVQFLSVNYSIITMFST